MDDKWQTFFLGPGCWFNRTAMVKLDPKSRCIPDLLEASFCFSILDRIGSEKCAAHFQTHPKKKKNARGRGRTFDLVVNSHTL